MLGLSRVAWFSGWLYWIATVLLYALPIMVTVNLLRGYLQPTRFVAQYPALVGDIAVAPWQAVAVVGIGVLSLVPLIAALLPTRDLFFRYRQGEILSVAAAKNILAIGRAMLLLAISTVLVPTLQMLALSWHAAQRTVQISLDDATLGFLLSAGLLTVIGWVMGEAAQIKAENEGFI